MLKLPGAGEGNGKGSETTIGPQGMKIDRMFFEGFEYVVKADSVLQRQVDNELWDQAIDYVTTHLFRLQHDRLQGCVPKEWREPILEYVKDYVSLNQFM